MNNYFMLSEKFKLELHWSSVRYNQDQIALLTGCYLAGPVLSEVFQLNQKDHIDLDFANQYIIFMNSFYIARFSWEGVKHTPEKIYLNNTILKNISLNAVPKLNANDYIVIDTKNHEDIKHKFNLVYQSYLIRQDGTKYDFRGMK